MFPEGRALEFLIAAVVALIVVGPKDLPVLLRKFGQFMAKVRAMAAEFRASFDEMARQSELDELRKEVEAMRSGQLTDMAAKASGIESDAAFDEINQGLTDVGVQLDAEITRVDADRAGELLLVEDEVPRSRPAGPKQHRARLLGPRARGEQRDHRREHRREQPHDRRRDREHGRGGDAGASRQSPTI